ncbi:MAG TPA: ABC transporter permease subunit [Actinocatenispora sp.]
MSISQEFLGGTGVVTHLLDAVGLHNADLSTNPVFFPFLVTLQVIWKNTGWGTIIYLAALVGIDQQLYEAAAVDGAGRWRRLWHVTLPGLMPVTILLLILNLGSILSVGFEQILLQRDNVGADAGEVLDTYVYFHGIVLAQRTDARGVPDDLLRRRRHQGAGRQHRGHRDRHAGEPRRDDHDGVRTVQKGHDRRPADPARRTVHDAVLRRHHPELPRGEAARSAQQLRVARGAGVGERVQPGRTAELLRQHPAGAHRQRPDRPPTRECGWQAGEGF